ncbi:MAG: FAD-dependent oxidoreductase, partial [Deltaproteobacteria bacterium]
MRKLDVIVIGLGGMGSSALYHLARKGSKVLGLEQFTEAHALGSSHGKTRLIRKAYFEHPEYVPLLQESYRLWDELEKVSNEKLLHKTGLTIFGAPESSILQGIRTSRDQHNLSVREHSAAEAQKWNSTFRVPREFIGMSEDEGGFLEVEKSVSAYLKEAKKLGAETQYETPCLDWGVEKESVWVRTPKEKIRAKKLVVTAGPWSSKLLRELQLKLSVHRVVQFWFQGKNQEIL